MPRSLIRRRVTTSGRRLTRAQRVASEDSALTAPAGRPFSLGTRPVIRWVKGDGRDDDVTRAAIGAATRLFGSDVDYCLCTNEIDASRVRDILAWAVQPVEWWPVTPDDNPELAELLAAADCPPEAYGYWWKWFPARVRPDAPEWILDGDMVVVGRPGWFDDWAAGSDGCRISQEDSDRHENLYGRYADLVDPAQKMYSGLVSVPPGLDYMPSLARVLRDRPLESPHDGRHDMSEQGVIAATFQRHAARTFPLAEFPFGRAFEDDMDFGSLGDLGIAWGYHFGFSFRMPNRHFDALTASGVIPAYDPTLIERHMWLGNMGQWGVPGWSVADGATPFMLEKAARYAGRPTLELGTSRGRTTALLAAVGCDVTTVDHVDRGAAMNLDGLGVTVVVADAMDVLAQSPDSYDLIVIDLHGNSVREWKRRVKPLTRAVRSGGRIIINNLHLGEIPEWADETGVAWLRSSPPRGFRVESTLDAPPGVLVLDRA